MSETTKVMIYLNKRFNQGQLEVQTSDIIRVVGNEKRAGLLIAKLRRDRLIEVIEHPTRYLLTYEGLDYMKHRCNLFWTWLAKSIVVPIVVTILTALALSVL